MEKNACDIHKTSNIINVWKEGRHEEFRRKENPEQKIHLKCSQNWMQRKKLWSKKNVYAFIESWMCFHYFCWCCIFFFYFWFSFVSNMYSKWKRVSFCWWHAAKLKRQMLKKNDDFCFQALLSSHWKFPLVPFVFACFDKKFSPFDFGLQHLSFSLQYSRNA